MTGIPMAADWRERLAGLPAAVRAQDLSRFRPPPEGGRDSAVLMLFGDGGDGGDGGDAAGPDLLLTQRAASLRSHPGQVSFPGGATDPGDRGPAATALREAAEETGLDPAGVDLLGLLPALYLPPSGFVVTPVLAWWRDPSPVSVRDVEEVARVDRVPLQDLIDPANRCTVIHPSGYRGPAFTVAGLFVWGFTAGLIDRTLALAGLSRPWPTDRVVHLDRALAAVEAAAP
jgi:8-oxo-dGTP pyrophosphatase MutT (NUDIX family)